MLEGNIHVPDYMGLERIAEWVILLFQNRHRFSIDILIHQILNAIVTVFELIQAPYV